MNELLYNDKEYFTERALHLHLELPTDVYDERVITLNVQLGFEPNVPFTFTSSCPLTCMTNVSSP